MKRSIILCIILSVYCGNLFTQQSIHLSSDSLTKRARICYQNNPSLAYKYSSQAIEEAILERSDLNLAMAYEMFGISLDYLGKLDSALYFFDKAIIIFKTKGTQNQLGLVYMSKANSLYLLNRNKEALELYLASYEILKLIGTPKEKAASLMGIANIYSIMKSQDLALKYYHQSLELVKKINDEQMMSYILTNMSEIYTSSGQISKGIALETQSLILKEKLNKDYDLVYTYINLADLLIQQSINHRDSALMYLNKAISLSKKLNNQEFLCSSYSGMANYYNALNDREKAITFSLLALELAKKIKNLRSQINNTKLLATAYKESKQFENAAIYLEEYIHLNDSANNIEIRNSFNELQTKYETDKKEQEIILLNERDKKRNYFIYSSVIVVVLLGLLSFSLYNRFRLKRKTASELETRNKEIEFQKHLIDVKQKEILDSINYAKRIQYALLAQDIVLKRNLTDFFVLFKPKDIVSGDFYWATEHQDKFYMAVCDSTGHGVPGAFMSLLNIGFLSEAVKEKQITQPNEILNYVRKRLIETITTEGQQDGMDAILICINKSNGLITYAAANNQPVLVNKNQELIELPKDKMPVGKSPHESSFTLFNVSAQKGDRLYLYTDGFADQFGGPKKKKYKYKQLHELISSNSINSFNQQKENMNKEFENWRGELEQIDDVLIIAIGV